MAVERQGDAAAMDEMLSAYLDGDLSPGERESVRVALEGDAALRERYRALAATVALLRDLPTPAPRRSFALTPEQARAARPDFFVGAIGAVPDAAGQFAAGVAAPVAPPYAAAPPPVSHPAPAPAPMPPTRARTAAPPGGVSPANVTPLRPRSPLARLVPLSGALSAVAAVLLIAVLTLDFTGGRGGNTAAVPVRPPAGSAGLPESVTLSPPPTFAPATTGSAARSGSGAPNAAVAPAPAQSSAVAQATTVAPQPTAVPAAPRSAPATDDAPNALVRVAEIALALLLVAGIAALLLGLRARQQLPTAG